MERRRKQKGEEERKREKRRGAYPVGGWEGLGGGMPEENHGKGEVNFAVVVIVVRGGPRKGSQACCGRGKPDGGNC